MDCKVIISYIVLYAYQICCWILWNLDMQVCACWISSPHTKCERPIVWSQSIIKRIATDNACLVLYAILQIIKKKYHINEQMQNDEIYFCTKLRSFFHIEHRQSNMNYRFTSSIFWTTVCLIEGLFWTQKQNTLSWRSCGTIDFITVISIVIFRKCTSSSRKQCDIQANNISPQIIWSTYLCWKIQ